MTKLFKSIRQISFSKNDIIFGLPIIDTNYNNILAKIEDLPYELYCIQCRTRRGGIYNKKIKRKTQYAVFSVRAEIDPDIYILHCLDQDSEFVLLKNTSNIM